jgi:hypothetical protein
MELSDIHCSGQPTAVTRVLLQRADEHIVDRIQPETSKQSTKYPRESASNIIDASGVHSCEVHKTYLSHTCQKRFWHLLSFYEAYWNFYVMDISLWIA